MNEAIRRGTPLATGQDAQVPPHRRLFDYQRLFQVAFRHEYYGSRRTEGDLFHPFPTRRTRARMQALGMAFRPQRDGFWVLYDTAQRWNARDLVDEREPLSFELVPTSSHFVSVTAMSLDTSPRATPFHFSNRVVADPQLPGKSGRDRAGEPPAPVRLRPDMGPPPAAGGSLIRVAADFGPIPIAVLDIFLDGAGAGSPCPMPRADGPPVSCVSYEVVFEARRTFWRYHVVPQSGSGPLDSLSIDPSTFLGPFDEFLIDGTQSYRFLSKVPIALASRSTARWSLRGRRKERMTRDAVLVERLPVPGPDQIVLLTGDEIGQLGVAAGVCSEMFVYV